MATVVKRKLSDLSRWDKAGCSPLPVRSLFSSPSLSPNPCANDPLYGLQRPCLSCRVGPRPPFPEASFFPLNHMPPSPSLTFQVRCRLLLAPARHRGRQGLPRGGLWRSWLLFLGALLFIFWRRGRGEGHARPERPVRGYARVAHAGAGALRVCQLECNADRSCSGALRCCVA